MSDPASSHDHTLLRQLSLRDLVLAQILTVVGSSWVGLAAGLGPGQVVAWLIAFTLFYAPMAVCVFYLNRLMPLEGGLYVWARRAFGDTAGFMTAWNIWAYALTSIATILFQIPSELAFMLGPRGAWIPESHAFVYTFLAVTVALLTWTALKGLALGKWIHNFSGMAMLTVFALLIVSPLWALAHGAPLHYSLALHLPRIGLSQSGLTSLSLLGQVLFAASGLEYIAIMAGETHTAGKAIGRSVLIASPIVFAMFVLGTASVGNFHGAHPDIPINYVAPIPQTLTQAFSGSSFSAGAGFIARLAILLLQLRILGAASYLFTGVTRLPMAAGWDHLVPEWFARLHGPARVPRNSILLTGLLVAALLVFGSLGVKAAEAFAVLNNTSSELYALAYAVMFLIPFAGAAAIRKALPWWVGASCAGGLVAILFILLFNAYPFVDVAQPALFAAKIVGTTLLLNMLGYAFYKLRQTPSTV